MVKAYTDGACTLNNDNGIYSKGPGGWAIALVNENETTPFLERYGGEHETTNNCMELTAILRGIEWGRRFCGEDKKIEIYSDSAYCVNIFTQWIHGWKQNGWTRGKKHEPIKNLDLIKEIDKLMKGFDVKFIKVKGHATDELNVLVDSLAVKGKEEHR